MSISKYPTPCEDSFTRLAYEDPDLLIKWALSKELRSSDLTFAAEVLGNVPAALPTLYKLLYHSSPIVREGAIYGLATICERIRDRIGFAAIYDSSPGVRASAKEHSE